MFVFVFWKVLVFHLPYTFPQPLRKDKIHTTLHQNIHIFLNIILDQYVLFRKQLKSDPYSAQLCGFSYYVCVKRGVCQQCSMLLFQFAGTIKAQRGRRIHWWVNANRRRLSAALWMGHLLWMFRQSSFMLSEERQRGSFQCCNHMVFKAVMFVLFY